MADPYGLDGVAWFLSLSAHKGPSDHCSVGLTFHLPPILKVSSPFLKWFDVCALFSPCPIPSLSSSLFLFPLFNPRQEPFLLLLARINPKYSSPLSGFSTESKWFGIGGIVYPLKLIIRIFFLLFL